jgi:hypothetical protein
LNIQRLIVLIIIFPGKARGPEKIFYEDENKETFLGAMPRRVARDYPAQVTLGRRGGDGAAASRFSVKA